MKVEEKKEDKLYLFTCSQKEYEVINKVIKEVLKEVPEAGMPTRLGAKKADVEALLKKFS